MAESDEDSNCSYFSWGELSDQFCYNNLSFLCLNARSITNKFAELNLNLSQLSKRSVYSLITMHVSIP